MKNYTDYLGIDISKTTFDTVNKKGEHLQYSNDKNGFKSFYKCMPKASLCVIEATGIYHLELAKFLHSKGVALSVVNRLRIKRFGQMYLKRNKTDKADAQSISLYAQQQQQVEQWTPAPEAIEQSNDIYQVMEQYIEFRAGLKNKLSGLRSKKALNSLIQIIENQILTINAFIEGLEIELEELSQAYNAQMLSNIKSIVGIGKRTAILLMIATEGFNGFDNANN